MKRVASDGRVGLPRADKVLLHGLVDVLGHAVLRKTHDRQVAAQRLEHVVVELWEASSRVREKMGAVGRTALPLCGGPDGRPPLGLPPPVSAR